MFAVNVRVNVSYQNERSNDGGLAKGLSSLKEMW